MENNERSEAEKKLLSKWEAINFSDDLTWIKSPEFKDFITGWSDLAAFYETHSGSSVTGNMSIEIIECYLMTTRILTKMLSDAHYLDYHTDAREALSALEYWMDEIVKQGYVYINENRE